MYIVVRGFSGAYKIYNRGSIIISDGAYDWNNNNNNNNKNGNFICVFECTIVNS